MSKTIKSEKTAGNKKGNKRDYIYAVTRQKEAVARVRLFTHVKQDSVWGEHPIKKEQILVNAMPIEHYFSGPLAKALYMEPLHITDTLEKYALTIKVNGGGKNSQLDAAIKGIAKALSLVDTSKNRQLLKAKGFITHDARVRERRKVGRGGKARRAKQSPKR